MNDIGLVHIYCGDGKGKSTAAVGAAVRAAGQGFRVLVARFLKTDDSGEVEGLAHVPGVTVLPCDQNFGFSWNMTQVQKTAAALYYNHCLAKAWDMVLEAGHEGSEKEEAENEGAEHEKAWDLLVLDEVIGACNLGFVDEDRLVELIRKKPEGLEVIITGRGPSETLKEQADYITEMVMRRHPYEKGISSRKGIEY